MVPTKICMHSCSPLRVWHASPIPSSFMSSFELHFPLQNEAHYDALMSVSEYEGWQLKTQRCYLWIVKLVWLTRLYLSVKSANCKQSCKAHMLYDRFVWTCVSQYDACQLPFGGNSFIPNMATSGRKKKQLTIANVSVVTLILLLNDLFVPLHWW